MKTILVSILEGYIIIPILIGLIFCALYYLIGVLPISKKETKMMQIIADLAKKREERNKHFKEIFEKKRLEYEKKHEIYTSFIVFLESTHYNRDIDLVKTKQKLNEIRLIASDAVKAKIPEYITSRPGFHIDTKPLKMAMQEELKGI